MARRKHYNAAFLAANHGEARHVDVGDSWVDQLRSSLIDGIAQIGPDRPVGMAHQFTSASRFGVLEFQNQSDAGVTKDFVNEDDASRFTFMDGHADEHYCGVPVSVRQQLGSAIAGIGGAGANTGPVARFFVNRDDADNFWENANHAINFDGPLAMRFIFWRPKNSAAHMDDGPLDLENDVSTGVNLSGDQLTGLSLFDDAADDGTDERFFHLDNADLVLDTLGGSAPTRLNGRISMDFDKGLWFTAPTIREIEGAGTPGDPYRVRRGATYERVGRSTFNLIGFGQDEVTGVPDPTEATLGNSDDWKRFRPSRMASLMRCRMWDPHQLMFTRIYIGDRGTISDDVIYARLTAAMDNWERIVVDSGHLGDHHFVLIPGQVIDGLSGGALADVIANSNRWSDVYRQVAQERGATLLDFGVILGGGERFFSDSPADANASAWLAEHVPTIQAGGVTYTRGVDYDAASNGRLYGAQAGHWDTHVESKVAAHLYTQTIAEIRAGHRLEKARALKTGAARKG